MIPAGRTWRRLRASWRDTLLLFREFRQPLGLFFLAIFGSGSLFYILSKQTGEPVDSLAKAVYVTMGLAFFQTFIDFPREWYLQIFFFIMPLIGISLLAQGLTEFGVMLFNRRARGKEWEMAVASTLNNHVVVIGLGHLGYRVVKNLIELGQDVVVIEKSPDAELVSSVQRLGMPVIQDDGTRESVLTGAGIQRARAIILCTQNDSLNLRMALKARGLKPGIEVVIRIFDEEFAKSLETQFGFHAMSATSMAAPIFAAIAARVDVSPPITIEGTPHIIATINIGQQSRLIAHTVNELEEDFRISVIMLCENGGRQFHPIGSTRVQAGHTIAVFGEPENIHALLHENRR